MKRINNYYFSFAGIRSDSLGVKCTSLPTRQHPVLKGKKVSVPGRSGFIFVDEKQSYDSIQAKQDIVVEDNANLPAVLNWLRGSGELIFGDDPDYAYDAMLLTATNRTSPMQHLEGQKMTLTFTCQPFRHAVNEAQIVLESGSVFNGQGHVNSMPLIKVEGSGSSVLIVNGKTMRLTLTVNVPLYIDCDAGTAYIMNDTLYEFAGGQVILDDDWFELYPHAATELGYNNVNFTGGITKLTITPRWRWF